MAEKRFSHLDAQGSARMVDVSRKPTTRRVARASCRVTLQESTLAGLREMPKGDAVTVARVAGIQAAKRTGELIPLAHTLEPESVDVEIAGESDGVVISSSVVVTARTGAEMEALVACAVAALTLYDMVKAVDREAVVGDLRLESKTGGARGDYDRKA